MVLVRRRPGNQRVEFNTVLFSNEVISPDNVIMLRENHECALFVTFVSFMFIIETGPQRPPCFGSRPITRR